MLITVNFINLIFFIQMVSTRMSRLDKYQFVPCGVAPTLRGCVKAMITLKQENHWGAGRDSKNLELERQRLFIAYGWGVHKGSCGG